MEPYRQITDPQQVDDKMIEDFWGSAFLPGADPFVEPGSSLPAANPINDLALPANLTQQDTSILAASSYYPSAAPDLRTSYLMDPSIPSASTVNLTEGYHLTSNDDSNTPLFLASGNETTNPLNPNADAFNVNHEATLNPAASSYQPSAALDPLLSYLSQPSQPSTSTANRNEGYHPTSGNDFNQSYFPPVDNEVTNPLNRNAGSYHINHRATLNSAASSFYPSTGPDGPTSYPVNPAQPSTSTGNRIHDYHSTSGATLDHTHFLPNTTVGSTIEIGVLYFSPEYGQLPVAGPSNPQTQLTAPGPSDTHTQLTPLSAPGPSNTQTESKTPNSSTASSPTSGMMGQGGVSVSSNILCQICIQKQIKSGMKLQLFCHHTNTDHERSRDHINFGADPPFFSLSPGIVRAAAQPRPPSNEGVSEEVTAASAQPDAAPVSVTEEQPPTAEHAASSANNDDGDEVMGGTDDAGADLRLHTAIDTLRERSPAAFQQVDSVSLVFITGPPGTHLESVSRRLVQDNGFHLVFLPALISLLLSMPWAMDAVDVNAIEVAARHFRAIPTYQMVARLAEELLRQIATGYRRFLIAGFPQTLEQLQEFGRHVRLPDLLILTPVPSKTDARKVYMQDLQPKPPPEAGIRFEAEWARYRSEDQRIKEAYVDGPVIKGKGGKGKGKEVAQREVSKGLEVVLVEAVGERMAAYEEVKQALKTSEKWREVCGRVYD